MVLSTILRYSEELIDRFRPRTGSNNSLELFELALKRFGRELLVMVVAQRDGVW